MQETQLLSQYYCRMWAAGCSGDGALTGAVVAAAGAAAMLDSDPLTGPLDSGAELAGVSRTK